MNQNVADRPTIAVIQNAVSLQCRLHHFSASILAQNSVTTNLTRAKRIVLVAVNNKAITVSLYKVRYQLKDEPERQSDLIYPEGKNQATVF